MHRENFYVQIQRFMTKQIREDNSGSSRLQTVAETALPFLIPAIMFAETDRINRLVYQEDGASGRIRTSDRSVRSRVLYPAELRMHR